MLLQFGIVALIFGVLYLGERWLRKRLHIQHTGGFFYERVNKTQSWIENGIFVLFLIIEFFYAFFVDGNSAIFFILILAAYFIAYQVVRFYFEWKYRRENREYIIILICGISYVPILAVVLFFLPR
ncbi:DUF4181 domain-containing protein [Sporolactobacillus vineae]|uniref:DUF4181 domain-containing protein n=1 Tax=Sporolactobacillus vineae TaxID=444463 RepID=UPI00028899A7|nr:DUF4181 domain-containing protein [Sporolactobacillus vineae]